MGSARRRHPAGQTPGRDRMPIPATAGTARRCPQGDEKVAAVREMFDAIAPRYDLVNRIMTFRLDVAVAPPGRPTPSACPSGSTRARPRLRHRRPLHRAAPAPGFRPVSVDLSFGMLAADRSGAPRVQADVLRLPVPGRRRSTASRAGSRCATSSTSAPSSTSWPGSCVPAAASPCSTWPCRRTRVLRWRARRLLRQGGARRSAALLSDPAAYRYLPRASPTSRRRPRCSRALRRAGFTDVEHAAAVGRHHPARHGDPRMRAVTRPPRPRRRPQRRSPAATAACSCATASAWPGAAWRRGCPSPTCPGCWPRSSATTRSAGRAAARWPSARCRSCPGAPAELVDPGGHRRQATRRRTRGSPTIDGADADARAWLRAASAPRRRGRRSASQPGSSRSRRTWRRCAPGATRSGPAG